MRHLILSVDHEILGNGTGDVRQHMIEPTERMARILEKYAAPLFVFPPGLAAQDSKLVSLPANT